MPLLRGLCRSSLQGTRKGRNPQEVHLGQDQYEGSPFFMDAPSPQQPLCLLGLGSPRGLPVCTLAELPKDQPRLNRIRSHLCLSPYGHLNLFAQSPFCPGQRVNPFLSALQGQRHCHEVPRGRWPSGFSFTLECDFPFQLETTQDGKCEQGSLAVWKPICLYQKEQLGSGEGPAFQCHLFKAPGRLHSYHSASLSFACP